MCIVNAKSLPLTAVDDTVSIVQKSWWAPGPFWTGVENIALTGIQEVVVAYRQCVIPSASSPQCGKHGNPHHSRWQPGVYSNRLISEYEASVPSTWLWRFCVTEWSRCCGQHFTATLGQNFIAWYRYMILEPGRESTKSLSVENSFCKIPRTYRKAEQATNESLCELWVIGGLVYAFSFWWHKYICYVIIWTSSTRIADILFEVKLFVTKFIGIMSNNGMPNWQMTKHPKDYRWMRED